MDLWERFYKEYPDGAYCEACGHEMYVSDPPHDIHCTNTVCDECPDYVHERAEEQEEIESYRRYYAANEDDEDDEDEDEDED